MTNKYIAYLNLTIAALWSLSAIGNFLAGNKTAFYINLFTITINIVVAKLYLNMHNQQRTKELEKNTAMVVAMTKPKEKVFDFFR